MPQLCLFSCRCLNIQFTVLSGHCGIYLSTCFNEHSVVAENFRVTHFHFVDVLLSQHALNHQFGEALLLCQICRTIVCSISVHPEHSFGLQLSERNKTLLNPSGYEDGTLLNPFGNVGYSTAEHLEELEILNTTYRLSSFMKYPYKQGLFGISLIEDRPERITVPERHPPDLPFELWYAIIRLASPTYLSAGEPGVREYTAYLQSFRAKRAVFAQLALVSHTWRSFVIPVLFQQTAIFLTTKLQPLVAALRVHGKDVRTIVVDTRLSCDEKLGWQSIVDFRREIVECIAFCPNVLNLEFYRPLPFSRRDWVIRVVPRLGRSLTSLVLCGKGLEHLLSIALVSSGRSLERLKLCRWHQYDRRHQQTLNLPNEMPRLQSLEIEGGSVRREKLTRLFRRCRTINSKAEGRSSVSVPLRSLVLTEVMSLSPTFIVELIQINHMCGTLTSLRVKLHEPIELQSLSLPAQLLRLCPSLIEFSYTSACSVDVFSCLPLQLESLELLSIQHDDAFNADNKLTITSTRPLVEFIQSGVSPKLRKLSIIYRTRRLLAGIHDARGSFMRYWRPMGIGENTRTGFWGSELEKACEAVGVEYRSTFVIVTKVDARRRISAHELEEFVVNP